jgi:hypothetical protein
MLSRRLYDSQPRYLSYRDYFQHDVVITEAIQHRPDPCPLKTTFITILSLQGSHSARCYLPYRDRIQHDTYPARTTFSTMLSRRLYNPPDTSFRNHIQHDVITEAIYPHFMDHIQHDTCLAGTTFSTIPALRGPPSARCYVPYMDHIQHNIGGYVTDRPA